MLEPILWIIGYFSFGIVYAACFLCFGRSPFPDGGRMEETSEAELLLTILMWPISVVAWVVMVPFLIITFIGGFGISCAIFLAKQCQKVKNGNNTFCNRLLTCRSVDICINNLLRRGIPLWFRHECRI